MTATIAEQDHGTNRGYTLGCKCRPCLDAHAAACRRPGGRPVGECVTITGDGHGRTSRCALVASALVGAQSNVRRIAKMASRSEKAFAKWSSELAVAKASRDEARQNRDEHMAECDAALARFGGAA